MSQTAQAYAAPAARTRGETPPWHAAVSYTHLTLPTILLV